MPERGEDHREHKAGKRVFFPWLLLLLAFLVFAGGLTLEIRSRKHSRIRIQVQSFEEELHRREILLMEELASLGEDFATEDPMKVLDRRSEKLRELSAREGISFFYYSRGILRYWSDHSIPMPERWGMPVPGHMGKPLKLPLFSFRNGYYMARDSLVERGRLCGLIKIKEHYSLQNRYLRDRFMPGFQLSDEVQLEFLEDEATWPVLDKDGEYLFSLDFSKTKVAADSPGLIFIITFILALALFFSSLVVFVKRAAERHRWLMLGLTTILVLLPTWIFLRPGQLMGLKDTHLFSPDLFASMLFPSLGHLLVLTLSSIAVVALWYRFAISRREHSLAVKRIWSVLLILLASILFLFIENLLSTLVLDSGISFQAFRITSISGYSILGLLILLSWLIIMGLFLDRALVHLEGNTLRFLFLAALLSSIIIVPAIYIPGLKAGWTGWVFMLLFLASLAYIRHHQPGRFRFSRFVFLLIFVSVFLVFRLQEYNQVKLEGKKDVELVKLASEHDPVAEILFAELSESIRADSLIASYLHNDWVDFESLMGRLTRNYFQGYWIKYDLRVTACCPVDSLYLEPPVDEMQLCYTFFQDMIRDLGLAIPGSDFYFMDNLNGKISYLASITFKKEYGEHRIILELDSKLLSEELGYPELLLDERYSKFTPREFSFARYSDGVLVASDGDFSYRRSSRFYTKGEETFETFSLEGYDHSIYNVDDRNTIIVGTPAVAGVDYLISFSYIFAFNFLVLALFYLLFLAHFHRPALNLNFKNRIQYSMVGILFLTFALICTGTIIFIIRQYKDRNDDNLRENMRSVYIELIHKVEFEEDLRNWSSDKYYNLDELLLKFANVFYSDINLYDRNGRLLATSREEIFRLQLLSTRMNREVFEELDRGLSSGLVREEQIGGQNYISGYVPLLNSENSLLAYLNLPYFTRSEDLTRDVTNMVLAVVNIYLILLLVILGLSVFLSDRITFPLRMIQNRIAHISLSEKNEMIHYDRSDEIRGLVEEYNFMVQELERSANLLAQSERESAWREMAKQIAHEIKNPLTPMKLNVQHLQRTFDEGKADPELVERISGTLIEQIDSLSAIANEFSDFAKMPRAKEGPVSLERKLENLVQLFQNTERANIILEIRAEGETMVLGDKEQLMRVFINLVKNSLQSIPEGRKGEVRISLETLPGERVLVSVADNGKGIPDEIRDRLFQPNFTTKSAGMGMGLAISHNIIRSMGGKLWFDTRLGEGSTFFTELPLMVDN